MTDLYCYVYPHGPYGLLEFGIRLLLLEADLAITTLLNTIIRPTYVVNQSDF